MRVMIIGAGWEQERLIRTAKERGHWVLATAWPSTYTDALVLADHGEIVNPRDISAIALLAERFGVEAVVADQCDYSYYAATWLADRMGWPGPTLAAAQVATNKYRQRQRLESTDILQPRYRLCATLEEVRQALKEIGYPAVFKPLDNRGNFGVNRVDNPDQVPAAFYEAIANAHSRSLLVEEFIEGTMTTVEGFMLPDGTHLSLVTSSKVMLGGCKRVAMELRYPAEFSPDVVRQLVETNQVAMRALGYRFGPTHTEYMVTANGTPYYIESANRGGGVLINSHIIPALTGVDPTILMLNYATGVKIEPPARAPIQGCAVLSFFGFTEKGKIAGFHGLEEARTLPGVVALRPMVRIGNLIQPITTDAGRHGFVIARGPRLQETLAVIQRAKEMVRVICQ